MRYILWGFVALCIARTVRSVARTLREWQHGLPASRHTYLRDILEHFSPQPVQAWTPPEWWWYGKSPQQRAKRSTTTQATPQQRTTVGYAPPVAPRKAAAQRVPSRLEQAYQDSAARRQRLLMEIVGTQNWDDAGEARLHIAEDIEHNGIDVSTWPGIAGDFHL